MQGGEGDIWVISVSYPSPQFSIEPQAAVKILYLKGKQSPE